MRRIMWYFVRRNRSNVQAAVGETLLRVRVSGIGGDIAKVLVDETEQMVKNNRCSTKNDKYLNIIYT